MDAAEFSSNVIEKLNTDFDYFVVVGFSKHVPNCVVISMVDTQDQADTLNNVMGQIQIKQP